jgi:hypothetical protein
MVGAGWTAPWILSEQGTHLLDLFIDALLLQLQTFQGRG